MSSDKAAPLDSILADINGLADAAKIALKGANTFEKIDAVRIEFLSKKGKVSVILKMIGQAPVEKRKELGQLANEAKDAIAALLDARVKKLEAKERDEALKERIDITLPGRVYQRGHEHPLSLMTQRVTSVLRGLGFEMATGPEIEHEFYNFEALNIPKDHPAREMQDTFYVNSQVVLRTQTSPVQIRAMLAVGEPPIRVASIGRVFRRDQDVTHSPVFHQVEGLFVDKGVTFADLKGTLTAFVEQIFGANSKIRLRPSYFPFTEPSAEVDMSCFNCDQKGCRLCKGSGWIEILGAGMVDPEVFKATQWDSERYSGFAFGIGVERLTMLHYAVSDIRHFYENDLRFLTQF